MSLDATGRAIAVGNLPLSMVVAPDGRHAIVLLSGWRTQGIQVVDLESGSVVQSIEKPSTFIGLAFSPDGKSVYASGGNDDAIYAYAWRDGQLVDERVISIKSKTGLRYPAGIAVSRDGKLLYVAENVGDSIAVIDIAAGTVVQRLATEHYPYAVVLSSSGELYSSAWGGYHVSIFGISGNGRLSAKKRVRVGRHPSALLLDGHMLYVALASVDGVAVVDTKKRKVIATLDDRSPGGPREGSTPNAMALSHDRKQIFVAEGDNNAVAVFDLATRKLMGRIPVDWYPAALIASRERLLVLNAKGDGTHPNPEGPTPRDNSEHPYYTLALIDGSIRVIPLPLTNLAALSKRVATANRWNVPRKTQSYPPFKHVIYIIKENRTYDQIFGDLPQGDGDPSLLFFPRAVSPNHHALAERFGLFDRFFTNAEVSAQGHMWSTGAYSTDYTEKTVHAAYADKRPSIDEGEVDEPAEGFLWSRAIEKQIGVRIYGELAEPDENKKTYHSTKREAAPYTSRDYPAFDMHIPDQKRADVWLAELQEFVRRGEMPQLQILHLPNDHTLGGRAGRRSPRAFVADNDLALGRIIEALSQSPFWPDTVVFVLEDDAQDGPDHVDSHRSICLVISAWSKSGVHHQFVNTTDIVGAIGKILGLRSMSQFDQNARPLDGVFAAKPDLAPYRALTPAVSLDEKNPEKGKAAELSAPLDFERVDSIDDALFNRILWEWRAQETHSQTR